MSRTPYLYRRGNVFYFRAAVPAELRDTFQRREIVQSLKTEKRSEAVPLALGIAAEVIKLFNDARSMPDDIKQKRRDWIEREKLNIKIGFLKDELEQKEFDHVAEIRRVKAETTLKTENETLKAILVGQSRNIQPVEATEPKRSNTPLLSAAIDEFLKQYNPEKRDMLRKHRANLPVLLELLGDVPVNQIRHVDINRFAIELCKLPDDRLNPKFKGMTFKQMIAANDGDCIHNKTFKNYKSSIKQLIEWTRGLYEGAFENVNIAEIKYCGNRTESENSQRAFKDAELERFFVGAEMKGYCGSGADVHKFWLPVVALFSGARVNEICQLNPFTDIKQDGAGIWHFWITEETESADGVRKSAKTDAAKRFIPMHSTLIELGLLEYIEEVKKAGHKMLFPQWKVWNERAGENAARDIRRYIESVGLRDETKNKLLVGMHAFRKTVITRAYKGGFIGGMVPIVGHESNIRDETGKLLPDVTLEYIDDEALQIPLSKKQETIEQLKFDIAFYMPVKPVFKKR